MEVVCKKLTLVASNLSRTLSTDAISIYSNRITKALYGPAGDCMTSHTRRLWCFSPLEECGMEFLIPVFYYMFHILMAAIYSFGVQIHQLKSVSFKGPADYLYRILAALISISAFGGAGR